MEKSTDKLKDKNKTGSCGDRWGPDQSFSPQLVTEHMPWDDLKQDPAPNSGVAASVGWQPPDSMHPQFFPL